ncbi:MAG: PAS domain-containing protein [Dehalococcoidia bacterium]
MAGRSKGKRIAKKLELSEVKYRELFDSINVCVVVLKPKDDGEDFIIKDINTATEKVEMIRLGEAVGKSVIEALPGIKECGIFDIYKRVWRTGEPERFPARECKNKRVKGWREGYIYRLPSGDIVEVYEDVTARIKAEDAVKKAELRYRTVADFTYDLEYWKGPDGKLLYISPSCERVTGYSVQEFMKDPQLLDRIVVAEDSQLWASHENSGGSFTMNEISFCIKRRDGEIRWIEHRCRPVVDENNKFLGIRGSNRDVSYRKHIEQQLSDSQERFRTLFLAAPIGLALADLEGRFIDVNKAFQQMLGFTRDELLNTSILDITHPDDKDLYLDLSGELVRGERPGYTVEKRFVKKDGATLWVNVSTVKVEAPDGRFLYRIGIIEDITERKKAAEALKESEARYRSLVETTGAGFVSVDLEGKILMVNESLCEITGYTSDEVVGQPFTDFVHPDDLAEAAEEFSRSVSMGRTRNIFYEMKILGKQHVVWMRFNPTEWVAEGRTIGMHAAMFDITDRKQAEEALMVSKEHFQALFMNMTQATALNELVFDKSGRPSNYRLVEVNPEYERIFKKKAEEVRSKLVTDIYPVQEPPFLKEFSEVALSRRPARFEAYYAWAGIFVDVSIVPWESQGFATIVSDITEGKRAVDSLRHSEELFRLLAENTGDVIWLADPQFRFTYVSPSIHKLRGFSPEEVMAQTLKEKMTPESAQKITDIYKRYKADIEGAADITEYVEIEQYRKEGSTVWVEVAIRAVYAADRKHIGFIGVSRDMSERKRA